MNLICVFPGKWLNLNCFTFSIPRSPKKNNEEKNSSKFKWRLIIFNALEKQKRILLKNVKKCYSSFIFMLTKYTNHVWKYEKISSCSWKADLWWGLRLQKLLGIAFVLVIWKRDGIVWNVFLQMLYSKFVCLLRGQPYGDSDKEELRRVKLSKSCIYNYQW